MNRAGKLRASDLFAAKECWPRQEGEAVEENLAQTGTRNIAGADVLELELQEAPINS